MRVEINLYTKKRDELVDRLKAELKSWEDGINKLWILKPHFDQVLDTAIHFYRDAKRRGMALNCRGPYDVNIAEMAESDLEISDLVRIHSQEARNGKTS